jgi:hypothetical protein
MAARMQKARNWHERRLQGDLLHYEIQYLGPLMLQPALIDLIRREIENIGGSAREQTLSLAVLMERAFI